MSKKPQLMLTYLCSKCGFDFARTEDEKPECFYCGNTKNQKLVSRKKISPEVIAERLKITTDRMVENLKKAWQVRPKEMRDVPEDEEKMLELLARAKKLRDHTQDTMQEVVKKSKEKERKKK